jgi:hypothetical protein
MPLVIAEVTTKGILSFTRTEYGDRNGDIS